MFNLDCDVDKEEWRPLCPIGLYGDQTALYGPELAFPWTPPWVREALAKHEPLVEVTPSCVVMIGFVTSRELATTFAGFAEPGQREGKLAHLFVMRPSGDVDIVKRPLILLKSTATDAMLIAGDYAAAYRGLTEKIEQLTGLSDIGDFIDEPVETWPEPNDDIPPIYARALLALVEGHKSIDPEGYVAFGYLMAKAEAEAQLLAAAKKGRAAAEIQARATSGRRLKSRRETEKLRIIAQGLIEQDRNISLTRCAKLVESRVTSDTSWTFKSDAKWITGHIRELFEKHSNGREYRPKRST